MTKRPSASKTLLQITANSASAIGMALILTLAGCKTPSEPEPAKEPEPATGSEFSQGETPVVEATEEALLNAMFVADRMVGRDDTVLPGLPVNRVRQILREHRRLQ